MTKRELKFMPHDKYVDKVLIGNWFENQCDFVRDPHDFKTNYSLDYYRKPSTSLEAFVWDRRFKAQGYGARILFDHQAPHYLENYSTLYDLSYNHYPKKFDGPRPREFRFRFQRYDPEQDYALNHGNVTKSGLLDFYREKWRCEVSDPRLTATTCYQETFIWPKLEKRVSWALPIPNSSSIYHNNSILINFKLRNKTVLMVPDDKIIPFCKETRCNPITWECPDPLEDFKPCKGPPVERKRKKL